MSQLVHWRILRQRYACHIGHYFCYNFLIAHFMLSPLFLSEMVYHREKVYLGSVFCLSQIIFSRCVKGRGLWYREPLFTYRKGHWPWSTLEASSSSESGGEFHSGMSTSALGKGSDYYPDLAIPRAKLKQNEQHHSSSTQAHFEQQKLASYLDNDSADSAIKIPRAKLTSGASTVERDGSDSVIFSDVHHALPPGSSIKMRGTRYSDSESCSTTSSDYTLREEIERRVITDTKRTETSKTITAEIHKDATAEFHVYPPIDSGTVRVSTLFRCFASTSRFFSMLT